MPPHAPSGNPVDMTFSLDVEILSYKIPEIVLQSGEVDGLVIHGVMRSGYIKVAYDHFRSFMNDAPVEALLAGMPDTSDNNVSITRFGKPIAISSFYDRDDDYTANYQDHGMPVFDSPEKTAGAMVAMLRHREVRERKPYDAGNGAGAPGGSVEDTQRKPQGGAGQPGRARVKAVPEIMGHPRDGGDHREFRR